MFKFRDKVEVTGGFYEGETGSVLSRWKQYYDLGDSEGATSHSYTIKLDAPFPYVECIDVEESLLIKK